VTVVLIVMNVIVGNSVQKECVCQEEKESRDESIYKGHSWRSQLGRPPWYVCCCRNSGYSSYKYNNKYSDECSDECSEKIDRKIQWGLIRGGVDTSGKSSHDLRSTLYFAIIQKPYDIR
jgi:hypothetical protein